MRSLRFCLAAALVAGVAVFAGPLLAQTNNTNNNANNNNGLANAPAGVFISPEGVFRVRQFSDKSGEVSKARMAESRARLGAELAKGSPLRKISLQRLEAAVAKQLAAGKDPSDDMRALAGLTRVQYVFYYPESKDIVIAGPAEGFFTDFAGRIRGITSGKAVVELQDLAAALRAFPPDGKGTSVISVSIDPTQEGLAQMNQYIRANPPSPGAVAAFVQGLKDAQGLHTVTINGVAPRTHFAQVLVEADYRMKLIGIGLEPPPVRMTTYVDRASSNETLQRWYFTPNYDCVKVAEDDLAMELVGQGVKLIGAGEFVAENGQRAAASGQSKASSLFCQAFTINYPQIAAKSPVYGQLKNLIDLSIAAAFIQKQGYYSQSGWKLDVLGDERQFPIEIHEAPKSVEPACNAIWKGNRLMTPIGGGVEVEPLRAVQAENRLADEKGAVKQAHQSVKLSGLAQGQWWWD